MTAEVAVMNKTAIALAADSAVTIRTPYGLKVYNTANKLFTLSKFAPVGVLVHNAAEINSIPAEILVKEFRAGLAHRRHDTLDAYGDSFMEFLNDFSGITSDSRERTFYGLIELALSEIFERALLLRSETAEPSDLVVLLAEAARELKQMADAVGTIQAFESVSVERVIEERQDGLSSVLDNIINITRQEHDVQDIDQEICVRLLCAAVAAVFSRLRMPNHTGIVVAGYGDKEYFPCLVSYEIDGFTPYGLRAVGPEASRISDANKASIHAVAQREMAETFMEGIDAQNRQFISTSLKQVFERVPALVAGALGFDVTGRGADVLEDVKKELQHTLTDFDARLYEFTRQQFTAPILEAIRYLDKSDLAEMAESLVSITALKRRVSLNAETVGGPVDVAIVSKHDGFVWIKRKHYFDIELNRSFMSRYLMSAETGGVNGA
jgi:hypothetical protein